MTNMTDQIREKLEKELNPTHLEVVNDSDRHQGHAGDDGSGESHFNISIASPLFTGKTRVSMERKVHKALSDELKVVHALSVTILTD
jgi:BolA protein